VTPVLAQTSAAQQVGTDNPPPVVVVPRNPQAPGPAGEQLGIVTTVTERTLRGETSPPESDRRSKKNQKYDISRIGERQVGRGLNLYSVEREQQLGKQLADEVEAQVKLVEDPAVMEYVNDLTQRLVRNSDARIPFTVKVIDDAEVNAFALPGGFLYVHTGLIRAAENEAELAGVIAHEIAHVAARHATKNMSRSTLWNLVSIPLVFAGGPAGVAVRQAAGFALPMSLLKFSRNAEREADLLAVQYEYAAGYDPVALIQIFERLKAGERDKSSILSRAFSCHPTTGDRIRRAQEAIATYLPARETYLVTTSTFDEVKARLFQLGLSSSSDDSGRPVLRRRTTSADEDEATAESRPN
jgi:predicted Zn-dependent protease